MTVVWLINEIHVELTSKITKVDLSQLWINLFFLSGKMNITL